MNQLFCDSAAARCASSTVFPPAVPAGRKKGERSAGLPSILESEGIKVTFPPGEGENTLWGNWLEHIKEPETQTFHKCISVTCKSWLCESCRRIKGIAVREQLIQKAAMFKAPRLYTITVNREWFASPEEAYHYVMEKKFISRLLTKEFSISRWCWVLEAQENSGDGWPHWHILIDVGDLPGAWYHRQTKETRNTEPENRFGWCYIPHFFDLGRVHRLLRKWKIGEQCYLSTRCDSFKNPVHAIRYITKYLIKSPERGFPRWLLETPGVRFYQPSRVVGSLNGEASAQSLRNEDSARIRERKIPIDRIAECRLKVVFVHYESSLDRYISTPEMPGIKDSVPLFPGSVIREDYDFESGKEFNTVGFEDISSLLDFNRAWCSPPFQELMARQRQERKSYLLQQWDSTLKADGAKRIGGSCGGGAPEAASSPPTARSTHIHTQESSKGCMPLLFT